MVLVLESIAEVVMIDGDARRERSILLTASIYRNKPSIDCVVRVPIVESVAAVVMTDDDAK